MDMSVTISPNKDDEAASPVAKPPRAANASDLDLWLEKVEALGELKRITAEVDPDLDPQGVRVVHVLVRNEPVRISDSWDWDAIQIP